MRGSVELQGSGEDFRVQSSLFRVQGAGFRVRGSLLIIQGLLQGSGVQKNVRVQGVGCNVGEDEPNKASGSRLRVQSSGPRVQGARLRVQTSEKTRRKMWSEKGGRGWYRSGRAQKRSSSPVVFFSWGPVNPIIGLIGCVLIIESPDPYSTQPVHAGYHARPLEGYPRVVLGAIGSFWVSGFGVWSLGCWVDGFGPAPCGVEGVGLWV